MIAVESEPLAALIARIKPDIPIPAGAGDLIAPKGPGWISLVVWLTISAKSLPTELIPDAVKVFQAWLMTTQGYNYPINAQIVEILFDWHALIESHLTRRVYRDMSEIPPSLNIDHLDDVRNEIRMIVFTYANLNRAAAERYLSHINSEKIRYHDQQTLLKSPGTLPEAAPGPYAEFVLAALIETDDPDSHHSRRRDYRPFEVHEHVFLDMPLDGGSFLTVLNSSRDDGLRLIRGLVEHATNWRREQYQEQRIPFPQIKISFPDGEKTFEGDLTVFRWARAAGPSLITGTALRALEAWGHLQIEAGRSFDDVLQHILGLSGSSVAFLSVAIDLALSHWSVASATAWPLAANPRLLEFDEDRFKHDVASVNRPSRALRQQSTAAIRVDLDAQLSRRTRLFDGIGRYVFDEDTTTLTRLRSALEQARDELGNEEKASQDQAGEWRAMVIRALRMTVAANWDAVTHTLQDGTQVDGYQLKEAPEKQQEREDQAARANAGLQRMNIRLRIRSALLEPAQSTPALLKTALDWARAQPSEAQSTSDDKDDNYDAEWDRRAMVMAAALAGRDYEAVDRADVMSWAVPVLLTASMQLDKEYHGSQIEHNTTAIATLGIVSLFLRGEDNITRRHVLRAAGHEHPAVQEALGQNLQRLGQVDDRLPRSIARIVMIRAIHPRRASSVEQQGINDRRHGEMVDATIDTELRWLDNEGDEPAWPTLAPCEQDLGGVFVLVTMGISRTMIWKISHRATLLTKDR
ncbi:hypothetical protein H8B02_16740 [Bradyrhizobium sp. Pear77]|uniref:hypothetical protein n=1 Tax=Bradyrhizobium altum TaxID=1571202 RepID=UPI001E4C4F9B|nr:hypothetical protein [Bradyrhizobium altum]MCC8955027.1 hypothetical protein [Bradyrhizobium altum]